MLADEQDKLNQMAPFPVAPAYSPHALMKTLRLAELPKTCVHTVRVRACVCLCEPMLTSADILLQIASCCLWCLPPLPLRCMPVALCLQVQLLPALVCVCVCVCLFVCVSACLCLRMGTHVYVVSVSYCSFLEPTTLST